MKRITAALALTFGMVMALIAPAHAVSVLVNIDPDGPAPANGVSAVAGLDWAPGNAIINNIECGTGVAVCVSPTSQIFAHSTLQNFIGIPPATGLNTTFEWTYTLGVEAAGFNFPVIGFTSLTSTGGGENFFRIFYDDTPDANQLAGTGFSNGTLVLEGNILPGGTNNFTLDPGQPATDPTGCGPLDQFLANNYPDINSVCGQGGGNLIVDVTFTNPAFFPAPVPANLFFNYTTQNNLPFTAVDPSLQFDTEAGGTVPGATLASIGNCNGCVGETAPNVMVQVDANSSFQSVSQPGALLLLGSGLFLTSLAQIVRRRRS